MRNGQAFVGFHEAPIDFPPTFKYDVSRKHRRRFSKRKQDTEEMAVPPSPRPDAGEESDPEKRHDSELSSEDDTTGELSSIISSGTTLSHPDQMSDEEDDSDAESHYLRRRMAFPQSSGGLVKRLSKSAAQRAKSKWAEFLHAPSPPRLIRSRRANTHTPQLSQSLKSVPTTPLLGERAAPSADKAPDGFLPSTPSLRSLARSSRSFAGDGTVGDNDDRGVYDSSSKQRVPSWCDRILFKSTVKPDDDDDDAPSAPQRTAVSLLAQAWRSFRRTSTASLRSNSTLTTVYTPTTATTPVPPSTSNSSTSVPHTDPEPNTARFPPTPTPYVPRRRRPRPRTIDVAAAATYASQIALATSSHHTPPSAPSTSSAQQTRPRSSEGAIANASASPTRTMAMSSPLTVAPDQHARATQRLASSPSRTPVSSSLASSTAAPSSLVPSSGAIGAAGAGSGSGLGSAGGGGGGRGNQRWRLLSFRSRDVEAARDAEDHGDAADAAGSTARKPLTIGVTSSSPVSSVLDVAVSAPHASPRPRKGDVVCLSYRTLDDQGMRRLEGRSDHRPVIGVYAIYV